MPMTKITTSGTFQLKDKAGYINSISVPAAGTSWTLQLLDGPNLSNGTTAMYGGTTPGAITTSLGLQNPIFFSYGIQVITSGTAGEIDIQWY